MTTIATWNVNSLKVRLPHVMNWLAAVKPDILALQETKLTDDNFPINDISAIGYQAIYSGQKTYNGVAILSKAAATDSITDIDDLTDPQRRILAVTINDIRIINLYVPNGEAIGSEKYKYKLHWLNQVAAFIQTQMQRYPKLVVLGDFNIAPTDADVREPDLWRGKVLCSELERQMFQKLLNLGLIDSFRLFEQPEKSYSWWDYRMLAFRRNLGLRIDHILMSQELAKCCQSCNIDKNPRKLDKPSDHTPVIAEFTCV